MTNARGAVAAVVLAIAATPAFAHRQDEYLQAMLVSVRSDRIALHLRLTPGVEAAPKVLGLIDSDRDGTISETEQRAYAERVHSDLSATLDGRVLTLRLAASTFPSPAKLLSGEGEVRLEFDADLPSGGGARRLVLENRHLAAFSVYLVNCVLPRDPAVRIAAQDRSLTQSRYQLEFEIDPAGGKRESSAPQSGSPDVEMANGLSVLKTYFFHGVRHILTGFDHLLFLSALVLAATTLWELVKVVTAFTIAHSVTLALAALKLVHLPEAVVEPLIATSIVFVALQNIRWPQRARGRSRLMLAFGFGLFHGLGFAGGLLELMHAMPQATALQAILGFSVGVEAGHLLVLAPLFGALTILRRWRSEEDGSSRLALRIQRIGSAAILLAGVYYLWVALS